MTFCNFGFYNNSGITPLRGGFARPLGIVGIISLKKKFFFEIFFEIFFLKFFSALNYKMILATYYFYAIFFILLTFTFKYENIASVNCCIQFEIVSDQMNQE